MQDLNSQNYEQTDDNANNPPTGGVSTQIIVDW